MTTRRPAITTRFQFDDRSILIGVLPLLIALSSAVDAFHPGLRRIVSLFILVVIWFAYLVLFGMYYLNRFPDEVDNTIYLGDFNGLASRPVPFDVGQLASDIIFAELVLISFMLYDALFHPHEASSVTVSIVSLDDPSFSHFEWFPHQRRVSHLDVGAGGVVVDFAENNGSNVAPAMEEGARAGGRSASSAAAGNPMFQRSNQTSLAAGENDLFDV